MSICVASDYSLSSKKTKLQSGIVNNTKCASVFDKIKSETKDWINDKDKICTDKHDDGKLSFKDAAKSFVKGVFGFAKSIVKHPIATGLSVAGTIGIAALTGGAALPIIAAAGAVIGAGQIGFGLYKAITANTDGKAKQAIETMGNGAFAFATSLFGANPALKAANKAGVNGVKISNNPFKNIIHCFEVAPDSFTVSKANIVSNLTGVFQPNSTLLRKSYEGYSKPVETEVYRFNPKGSTEEILANNPHVSFETETGKYYVQTNWGEKAYIDLNKEYLIATYGEGDYNAIAGDIFQESYVDSGIFNSNGTRQYINPESLEYGVSTKVTKQAPIRFSFAKPGTKYKSLEGIHTLEPESVIMVDSKGNPYQNTIANLLKRNTVTSLQNQEDVYSMYNNISHKN